METSQHKHFDELELEVQLHFIGYKKVYKQFIVCCGIWWSKIILNSIASGKALDINEKTILNTIQNEGTVISFLRYLAAQRLLKNNMGELNVAITK